MLDIKFVRSNPDIVKENIKKKFQNEKLPLVDEVLELDKRNREIKQEVEALRADKNKISKKIGACMAQGKKEEAEELKNQVEANAGRTAELSSEEKEVEEKIKEIMMVIPNIIDPSVRMSERITMGKGNIVCAGNILTVDITLGDFNIINLDCTVGHDAVLHSYVTVYPSVNISGCVEVGEASELGTGSHIIQGVKIGSHAIVGAGSVVIREIPSD